MNSVVFTFGRFNPPTKGHEKLVRKVQSVAIKQNADSILFLSQTNKVGTDPLKWDFKHKACKSAFSIDISEDLSLCTPFDVLNHLSTQYDSITFVVGADRQKEFMKRMNPYAVKWGIKKFNVISAGKRNALATDVTGISGTKMRAYALNKDIDNFLNGLPDQLNSTMKKQIYLRTQKGLIKTT
jgi:nicotinic acid mononucleotide adenylyltransferase